MPCLGSAETRPGSAELLKRKLSSRQSWRPPLDYWPPPVTTAGLQQSTRAQSAWKCLNWLQIFRGQLINQSCQGILSASAGWHIIIWVWVFIIILRAGSLYLFPEEANMGRNKWRSKTNFENNVFSFSIKNIFNKIKVVFSSFLKLVCLLHLRQTANGQ